MRITHFVNGNAWNGKADRTGEVFNPATGEVTGHVDFASNAVVDEVVASAQKAFEEWRSTSIAKRTQILFAFREILNARKEEVAALITAEHGKVLSDALGEVTRGQEVVEFACGIAHLLKGGYTEGASTDVDVYSIRQPLGVVAIISPFNFPAMVPMWTIPIALTLGNAYIWKPSEKTPLTSLKIANALKEAGLPDGVFSVLQGGATAVEAIIDHPKVKAIGFVGSTKIAKLVYQRGTHLGKRVLALGGAKNHIVLLPDANLELSGAGISDSFTGCAGQRCMAASVLLAVGDVEKHIQKIIERASSLKLGETMGAIITREQVEFLKGAIDRAEKNGAKILLDGRKAKAPQGFEDGHWLGPTILDLVTPGSEASTTELFGPVLSIVRCKDISQFLAC